MERKLPVIESPKRALLILIGGFCMGAADLVPGISGGTVALMLGFYPDLITSLRSLRAWRFLLTLLCGIALAMLMLSRFLHDVLNDPSGRTYLYAVFFGLISAAIIDGIKREFRLGWLVLGVAIAWPLTSSLALSVAATPGWMLVGGMAAVCAMLLPGISGSYILHLLGLYPSVIGALAGVSEGLTQGAIAWEAFWHLSSLGLGIVIGGLCFCRVLYWLLQHHPRRLMALLTGMMLGSLHSLWPFAGMPSAGPSAAGLAAFFLLVGISSWQHRQQQA